MSLVRLQLNRYGHIELSFVSARILRRVLRTVVAHSGPNERTAYVQAEADVNALRHLLGTRKRKDQDDGWELVVRMDCWEAAHYYGYDTSKAYESRGQ